MKKIYQYLIVSMIIPASVLFIASGSGSPGGKTGSPGDSGATCNQCHIGNPNTASNWITSDIPQTGYLPGQTYTITATGSHVGVQRFGFELTAEDNAGGKVGTFAITNSTETKLTNNNMAVTHKSAGTTPSGNTKTWSVNWTAPTNNAGEITFFASFNAANGNGSTSGDVIYLSSLNVLPNTTSVAEHSGDFEIYPNPTQGNLNIVLPDASHGTSFEVFNLNGQLIKSFPVSIGKTSVNLDLPVRGTYLVKMQNQGSTELKKLVVL